MYYVDIRDMTTRESSEGETPSQRTTEIKIDPIAELPLMNNSAEMAKDAIISRARPVAITRPTRTVHISYEYPTEINPGPIKICLLCTEINQCDMCCCTAKKETPFPTAQDEREFVSAQKPDLQDLFDQTEKNPNENIFAICNECTKSKNWPIVTVGKDIIAAKFLSVKLSLAFYQSHRNILSLSWGYEIQPVLYKPEEKNIRISILEKVFTEPQMGEEPFYKTVEDPPKKEIKPALVSIQETEKSRDFICMAIGRASNISLQARIKDFSQNDLLLTVSKLSSHVFFYLAKHKYGTYVIQLIISMVKDELLLEEIKRHISIYSTPMLQHEIGNYVVQRVIDIDRRFVFDCFMKDFKNILCTRIGSRAFKNCIKSFSSFRKDILSMLTLEFQLSLPIDEQKVLKAALKELFFVAEKDF